MKDFHRTRIDSTEQYIKTVQLLLLAIKAQCLKYQYPKEMIPENYTAQSFLETLIWEGAFLAVTIASLRGDNSIRVGKCSWILDNLINKLAKGPSFKGTSSCSDSNL